jgi:hypothetical protein
MNEGWQGAKRGIGAAVIQNFVLITFPFSERRIRNKFDLHEYKMQIIRLEQRQPVLPPS